MIRYKEQSIRKFIKIFLIGLVVLILLAFVALCGRVPSSLSYVAMGSLEGVFSGGSEGLFDRFVASSLGDTGQSLSEGFEEEVVDPGDRRILVSCDGDVVGIVYECSQSEVMGMVSKELESKGWTRVESGNSQLVSFLKSEGAFRWLLLSVEGEKEEACATFLLINQES